MKLDALYLVNPHAEEIATKEKTALVKAKRYDVAGKTYWLATDGFIYGTVQLGPSKEITLQEFTKLFQKHRVTEDERNEWWPGKTRLFYYPVVGVQVFKKPWEWQAPAGAQVFVKDVEVPTDAPGFSEPSQALEQHVQGKAVKKYQDPQGGQGRGKVPSPTRLVDLNAGNIRKLPDQELLSKHHRMHQLWANTGGEIEGMTREDFVNLHLLLLEEMERRGMQHKQVSDLDRAAERLRKADLMADLTMRLNEARDVVLVPGFVSVVGAYPDGRVPHDLDVLFMSDSRDTATEQAVVEELYKCGKRNDFPPDGVETVWKASGPNGRHIALYDLVLRKRQNLELMDPQYVLEWGEPVQAHAFAYHQDVDLSRVLCMEPWPEGERFLVQLHDGLVRVFSTGGQEVDMPGLRQLLGTVENPSKCMLDVVWDGEQATAIDMLRWWSTELVDLPLQVRRYFLDKARLGQVQVNPHRLAARMETFEGQAAMFGGRSILVRHWDAAYYEDQDQLPWAVFAPAAGTVELFRPLIPLKSRGGYGKLEFFKPETAWQNWGQGLADQGGIAIEKKFDGIRFHVHLRDKDVKVYTEDKKRDRAHAFPESVAEAFREWHGIPGGLVLDAEMVEYQPDGKPERRENMIQYVVGKGPFDDSRVQFNVFDILYHDGKDLHGLTWEERQKYLDKVLPKDTKHFHRVRQAVIAKTRDQFLEGIRKAANLTGSEGAMLKWVRGDYPLDGGTGSWAKFKTVKQLYAVVTGKTLKKTAPGQKAPGRTWVYSVAIRDGGKEYPLGNTFGTNIDAKVGTILELNVNNVFQKLDADGKLTGYGLFLPWVVAQAPERSTTSSKSYLDQLVEIGQGVRRPTREIKLADMPALVREAEAAMFQDEEGELTQEELRARVQELTKPYLVRQEKGKSYPFVWQWHIRGIPPDMTSAQARAIAEGKGAGRENLSIHGDIRFERPGGLDLLGWTLFTPGNPGQRDKFGDWKTWEDRTQATKKSVQPRAWLKVEGRAEPGEVGATTNTAALFIIKGTGRMTYGTQKPDFHEYFLKFDQPNLKHLNGRWVMTEIPKPGAKEEREAAEKAGRKLPSPLLWQFWKPKEQEPYVDTNTEMKDRHSQLEIWQYSPVPDLDIPRAQEPKSKAAQEAGPGKPVLEGKS